MSDMKYGEASLRAREHFSNKIKTQLNKNATDYGLRFVKLTGLIPNWETYLTPKQREAALRYLRTMNAYDVDYQLKLSNGTTHQRLFGSKTSKGAIGRLEEVYKMLENNGHYAEQTRKKEAAKSDKKRVKLTEKTLMKVKELFSLINEHPEYEQYLTKAQAEKVNELIRTRSFVKGAKACSITTLSYQQALIGDGSVLERLRGLKESKTVNSWDEL